MIVWLEITFGNHGPGYRSKCRRFDLVPTADGEWELLWGGQRKRFVEADDAKSYAESL